MQTGPEPFDADITSGKNTAIWATTASAPAFQPLGEAIETDILVIGGGVAGMTTAYCLAQSGLSVTVVDDGFLGSGETGRTTAHLTYITDERYSALAEEFGMETAKTVLESHRSAISWIEKTVQREQIDCDFRSIPGYLFTHPSDTEDSLTKEFEAVREMGAAPVMLDDTPALTDGKHKRCISFPGQAEIHPLRYLHGLAQAVIRMGGRIFTQSKAENIAAGSAEVNGFRVTARHIVIATNNTVDNRLHQQTKQWPYRSCAIAVRIPDNTVEHAFWWDTGNMDSIWQTKPYHYVRLAKDADGHDLLIVGGEDHRTAQGERENITQDERCEKLYAWAKAHFPQVGELCAQWSGQIMYSIDSLAFIGRNPGLENTWLISGDSGNGMTYAAIAGMLLTDLIHGRENPWETIYDPARTVAGSAPGEYAKGIGNMVRQYGDWLTSGDAATIDTLQNNEGAVIRKGLRKIAVYKDETGKTHTCSAVCPHMGGILRWNDSEKTFECPVHGSRFTGTGKVVNGPANDDLSPLP